MDFLVSLSPSLSWSWLFQSSENSHTAEQLNGEEEEELYKQSSKIELGLEHEGQ